MRLIVWNCQGGFKSKKKFSDLINESPDIAIVPECLDADARAMRAKGFEVKWVGDPGIKGLAVFAAKGWHLEPMAISTAKWILPVKVTGPENFTLLAVWSCPDKGSKISYVSMLHNELRSREKEWFAEGQVVVAGDFNSNPKLDREGATPNHNSIVSLLEAHNLLSAYHFKHPGGHGNEIHKTFFMGRKRESEHHIDFIFVPSNWKNRIARVNVLPPEQWLLRSDHCPLTLELCEPETSI
jgi:exonuclease III